MWQVELTCVMIGYVIRVYILSVATQPGGCIFSIGVSILGKLQL